MDLINRCQTKSAEKLYIQYVTAHFVCAHLLFAPYVKGHNQTIWNTLGNKLFFCVHIE